MARGILWDRQITVYTRIRVVQQNPGKMHGKPDVSHRASAKRRKKLVWPRQCFNHVGKKKIYDLPVERAIRRARELLIKIRGV
jgi:hypothetical protein